MCDDSFLRDYGGHLGTIIAVALMMPICVMEWRRYTRIQVNLQADTLLESYGTQDSLKIDENFKAHLVKHDVSLFVVFYRKIWSDLILGPEISNLDAQWNVGGDS